MNTSTTSAVQTHTPQSSQTSQPKKAVQGEKLRGYDKVARIPIKIIPTETAPKNLTGYELSWQNQGKLKSLKRPCVPKNCIPYVKKPLAQICLSVGAMARQPL